MSNTLDLISQPCRAVPVQMPLGSEAGFVTGANLVVDGGMTRRMIYAG